MRHKYDDRFEIKACSHIGEIINRNINPRDLYAPPGYRIEPYVLGLDNPIGFAFSDHGDLFIADSGSNSGISKVIRLQEGRFDIMEENFNIPITGISHLDGNIYVSHKGYISVLRPNGTRQNIIAGLPGYGDFGISNVAFGPEGKLYFGVGTVTNSGVVGDDNQWVATHPFLYDNPAVDITLIGQNFESKNLFTAGEETVSTGAFSPFGVPNSQGEIKKGYTKASGSILRANRDGTKLELVAWGFRNPLHIEFDREFRLFAANRSYDVRGSRPIANAPDEFHFVSPGLWYGWPDYSAGEPLTLPKFQPEGEKQPGFLLAEHPNLPPRPFAKFPPHSTISGFDFSYNSNFGAAGDVYIAEFGSYGPETMGEAAPYQGIGHKVSRINMRTGEVSTFISNRDGIPAYVSGRGGFGRPIDVKFGPDGAMYILDHGISDVENLRQFVPNSGVIWRVTRGG